MTRLVAILIVLAVIAISAFAIAIVISVGFTAAVLLDEGQARVA
jgi:hypothetical protein